MNGRDVPRDHEFPVRAIVPGHYVMTSVKWLTRIQAVREPFHGYWQTSDCAYRASMDGKSVRRAFTVSGAAWSGEIDVAEIAVSTNGGQSWAEAEFVDPVRRHAWQRWKFDWLIPKKPGQHTLLARAKDARGVLQPDEHDQDYGSHVINHSLPIDVFVDEI
jgi:DMSO/TMAO reductase YedYZ molybdopterin-dependent catalytic subunit